MLKRWRIAPLEWLVIAALIAVTAKLFGDIVWHMIYTGAGGDYQFHIQFAHDIVEHRQFTSIHLLFQVLIIGLASIFSTSYEQAAYLAATGFYVATAVILYGMLRGTGDRKWWQWTVAAAGALALLLVTPITLLTMPENKFYFGYVGINVAHNPTMVMLKPFALLLFAFALNIIQQRVRLSLGVVVLGVMLVALCLFAKPNFVLTFLPALLALIPYYLYRRRLDDLKTLVIVLIVPMIGLLGLQYVLQYQLFDDSASIIFAPLGTIIAHDPVVERLPVKFILSILFPLVVYVLYVRRAFHDLSLNLGWLTFFSGAAQMYLFAESGERFVHGNLWWSAQIGLFVLFVVSTIFWLRHFRDRPNWRGWVCLAVLLVHVYCGYVFYLTQLQTMTMEKFW